MADVFYLLARNYKKETDGSEIFHEVLDFCGRVFLWVLTRIVSDGIVIMLYLLYKFCCLFLAIFI